MLALAVLALCTSSCLGSGSRDAVGEAYTPPPPPETDTIGYFLASYDKSLRRWNELKLAPQSERDVRTLRALDASLRERARDRQDELVATLETGPPINREVAAVALGFTRDPAVLSPLLSALSDPSQRVVQKALLGLGVLEDPATPLAQPIYLLQTADDAWTRNNAAYALQRVVAAGGRDEQLASACRDALFDEEPGVRAQAASILGMLRDVDSVPHLGDLLHDEVGLVRHAAARALVHIGREHLDAKGDVARLLVDALDRAERPQRMRLRGELVRLADRDLGEEIDPWREWAYRMP